ncbi:nucleotidyltransferase domain-containing protein [Catenulispora subtropica]|uniref:Polymerase nucleotidyl transferase domain-containing protein n=1 Tax=Catenulispora subtropica TaxID=450798 RepID=A0ABN2S237_9ACTN
MAYELAANRFLRSLNATLAPGLVRGFYVVGSAALGSWRPGRSDLDVLVLLERALTASELAAVSAMHAELEASRGAGPHSDGHYVTPDTLGVRSEAGVPTVVDGVLDPEPHRTDPVLWALLDRNGITLRGPKASELGAAPDPAWLREWNHRNLESYWRSQLTHRSRLATRDPKSAIDPYLLAWDVTGPGRLHATIATGQIISKEAAADYTADLFPHYADLCARAMAYRLGNQTVTHTASEALRALDLVEAVCDSARKLP